MLILKFGKLLVSYAFNRVYGYFFIEQGQIISDVLI